MFSANQTPTNSQKDTTRNVEATGKFVWNLATYPLREEMNKSAEPVEYGIDEFVRAGLEKEESLLSRVRVDEEGKRGVVMVPMVKASPIKFECEHYTTLRLPGSPPMGAADVVIGKVIGVHIDERVLTDGKIDIKKTEPIARCGYYEYTVVREVFEMRIPGEDKAIMAGLENRNMGRTGAIDGDEKGLAGRHQDGDSVIAGSDIV
jgi:flavin reductase (DIM6/NTAB) family NADH-FMN oxidoreductase RutF